MLFFLTLSLRGYHLHPMVTSVDPGLKVIKLRLETSLKSQPVAISANQMLEI
jgi:hypothetical protein